MNKSKEVIDFIIELLENDYDVIPLIGNHEAMLLDAYENEKYGTYLFLPHVCNKKPTVPLLRIYIKGWQEGNDAKEIH